MKNIYSILNLAPSVGTWLLLLAMGLCGNGSDSSGSPAVIADESTNKTVQVITRCDGEETHFYVENRELVEITMSFSLDLTNLKSTKELPLTKTFPPQQTTEAFSLAPIDEGKFWQYSFNNYYKLGSNCAIHDDSYLYCLPYAPGEAFRVSQGYDGKFSHRGPNRYAIDWRMPVGTPVHAARGGLVIKVKDNSEIGGPSIKFDRYNNYVIIRHDDGTLGQYAHLSKGIKVQEGETVAAGELLAFSGNTGFTTGPHLHFSVYRTLNGQERVSIPVKFKTVDATAITLKTGHRYISPNITLSASHVRAT